MHVNTYMNSKSSKTSKSKKTDLSEINIKPKVDNVSPEYKKLELAKQLSREQLDLLVNIKSFLQEYLEDFIVIGHAINGYRVNISHAPTPRDQDSLEQYYTDNLILMKNKKNKEL